MNEHKGRACKAAPQGLCVATLLLLLLSRASVEGHGALDVRIDDVSRRLLDEPDNAALYVTRASLRLQHGEFLAALDDESRARIRGECGERLDLLRIRCLLGLGRTRGAMDELDSLLAEHPASPTGLLLRARTRAAAGMMTAADRDYRALVEGRVRISPDVYREWARARVTDERPDDALRVLNLGLERLGPIVSLLEYAIEVNLHMDRYDEAIERIDFLIARGAGKERWLIRRGEVLLLRGDRGGAAREFDKALRAIEALPENKRVTPVVVRLQEKAVRQRERCLQKDGAS